MITTIVSFDGTTFAPDYEVGFVTASEPRLPPAQAQMLARIGAWPVIVALQRDPQKVALVIRIVGTGQDALRSALFRLFDPEEETAKLLVAENHDGIAMQVYALCEDMRVMGDQQHDTAFVVTLAIDGDVRWRASTPSTDAWNITASGQTNVIANTGEDEVYATFEITPTTAKSGGYDYMRYCLVTWRAINAGSNYPIRIGPLDTATLVSGGKMQADGDDLRVFVDGTEVPRWLVDINDANTYVWFSTAWLAAPTLELTVSIAGAGTVDSIAVDDADEMAKLPSRGFVRVGSEVFAYSAKDTLNSRLTGIERAVWGTSMGAHSAGDDVYWMQHEVMLVYGRATAPTPWSPWLAKTEPIFTLASSSNTSWVYAYFGQTGYFRGGAWGYWGNLTITGLGGVYPQTQRTLGAFSYTEYAVAGAWIEDPGSNAFGWYLSSPCGIVNAAWASGQKRADIVTDFLVHLMYWIRGEDWWSWQATLADPANPDTWEAWSEGAAGSDWEPAETLAIAAYFFGQDVEVGTVTVSLNSDETPVVSIGSESGNYSLTATLTNETTDEALTVALAIALNEAVEIDTDLRTVTYLLDGSNQFQAVSLDSARRHWLRLLPGNNTLRFDDTGTVAVTVDTGFARRYY